MNITTKNNIVDALEQFLKEHSISQNEFAAKTKINSAYISVMLKRKYTTNAGAGKEVEIADKWFKKIAEFIGFSLEKTYWEARQTPQMMHMVSGLIDAKAHGNTVVLIGESGCGKSFTTNLVVKQNPTDTFVVTIGSNDILADIIDKVMDVLNLTTAKTKGKKIRKIVAHLREMKMQGKTPMLIFDESEYMKQMTLCMMKEFYDGLHGYCAIALIGTNQLLRKIENMRKKNKDGIPQFYRRIKFGIRHLPLIDKTFNQFLNGLEKQVIQFVQMNCDNYGELHDMLVPVMREADRAGEKITEAFIRKVHNMPKMA
ncbi:ATP-binding protein [Pinibacter soli]|uniref:ATP-binding protein n=1 Tax=Pinibacter soli TaxID=3044211 RepID=A0ABT6R9B8_9BACT|nr:ATP-binding protein [Pinibacter soli]MDI3319159.1 ATP-binding protein [Pinibacter soli]